MLNGKDKEGLQVGQSTFTIANIDKDLPTVTYNKNGEKDVKIASTTVTVSDAAGSGLNIDSLEYIWDTQNTEKPTAGWTKLKNGERLTKDVNGSYYLWVKGSDNVGNEIIDKSNLFRVDNIAPINPVIVANPSVWTNTDVKITITYLEDTVKKEYSLDGTIWRAYTGQLTVDTNNTTIYARGSDAAGNQSGQSTLTVANIDREIPTVAYSVNGADKIQIATTTAIVSDTGGSELKMDTLQYVWDTQNSSEPSSGWLPYANGVTLTQNIDGTYYLWIKASDNAGNKVVNASNAFNSDNTDNTAVGKPVITATPTGWTNGSVTASITYPIEYATKEYSIDGVTWQNYVEPVIVTENNVTIYAKRK